ncbi:hypothetical protein C4B63_28g97 [Trypanosoma cruzi]|uniref:Uncharacterized protein n=1 Tax=Trypanosoma cruzi TaxID=5693 RepID=A0A2V2VI34_TRYCR|nr:hypothetical protein C4B63_28g97 [Trypanosoma cruzi]
MGTDPVEDVVEGNSSLPAPCVRQSMIIPSSRLHCRRLNCSPHAECHGDRHAAGSDRMDVESYCPVARYGHSLTEIQQDVLFLFGGVSQAKEYLNDAWILRLYDAEIKFFQLEVVGDVPCGRFGHSAHRMQDGRGVIIFGGSNNREAFNDLYLTSLSQWTKTHQAVFQRVDMHSPPPNSIRPVVGSSTWNFATTTTTTAAAAAANTTRETSSLGWPSPRRSHTLVPMAEGKAILFGGHGVVSFNDVWVLDENALQWKCVETRRTDLQGSLMEIPAPRYCHSAVVYPDPTSSADGRSDATVSRVTTSTTDAEMGRSLYVFGGVLFSPVGDTTLWELNLSKFVWRRVKVWGSVVPPPRFGHTACVLSHYMVVFGGTDKFQSGNTPGDCFMYNFCSFEWSPLSRDFPDNLIGIPVLSVQTSEDETLETERTSQLNYTALSHSTVALRGCQSLFAKRTPSFMPPGRRSHAAARSSRGKIIIFGGWDGNRIDGDCFQLILAPSTLREWSYDFLVGARRRRG